MDVSPAFDLNPDPRPGAKYLSTAIDYEAREARIDTVLGVAELFRLDHAEATAVLGEVLRATRGWRRVAAAAGLDTAAVERMAGAFEHQETDRAHTVVGAAVD